ncbi:MAG: LysE family translocator [Hyphomicrobiales bacterium]|nr:LysE family translocator [Hyphomicrobiales bacterium]MDE2016622.1 LysE family translocator [Hyphomicrobiales bacterium]
MVLASGLNFGLRRTLPHVLGVTYGFFVLMMAAGAGLGALFAASNVLYVALQVVAVGYLLWLAWKIAHGGALADKRAGRAAPMSSFGAALFQWANPKGWVAAISGMALYVDRGRPLASTLFVAGVFAAVTLPSVLVWAGFGATLSDFLASPARRRAFNWTMALLLAASALPILFERA